MKKSGVLSFADNSIPGSVRNKIQMPKTNAGESGGCSVVESKGDRNDYDSSQAVLVGK